MVFLPLPSQGRGLGGEVELRSRYLLWNVPKIMSFAIVLKNLDKFGFDDISPDPPWFTSDVEIPSGVHLGMLARASGTSLRRVRELNPEILGDVVPGRGRDVIVHIPSSGLACAKVMLPKLLFDPDADGIEARVSADFDWGRDELASSPEALAPAVVTVDPKPGGSGTPKVAASTKPPAPSPPPIPLKQPKSAAVGKSTLKIGSLLRTRPTTPASVPPFSDAN